MTLQPAQKVQLSELYDSEAYKVLKQVLEAKIIELGLAALNSRTEVYTAEQRGFSQGLDWVHGSLKKIHAEVNKLEAKAQKPK